MQPPSITTVFDAVANPRRDTQNKLHLLADILAITTCAVIGGAETWEAIAEFGWTKEASFRRFLALPNGIPGADTFARVFAKLDPVAFAQAFGRWMAAASQAIGLIPVAIDGKSARGAKRSTATGCLHVVRPWAAENRLVLGATSVADGSNEIAAIPELLRVLDLAGAIVTIDAAGCQVEYAGIIREKQGHYLLTVKDNQPKLRAAVEAVFDRACEANLADVRCDGHEEVDDGHGRHEGRDVAVVYDPTGLPADWPDVAAVVVGPRRVAQNLVDRGRSRTPNRLRSDHRTTPRGCLRRSSPIALVVKLANLDGHLAIGVFMASSVGLPGPKANGSARRSGWIAGAVLAGLILIGGVYFGARSWSGAGPSGMTSQDARRAAGVPVVSAQGSTDREAVRLSMAQQQAVGLRTARMMLGETPRVATAPGRVAPNETAYAFITPRAPGVVRAVLAHIGQEVHAGDLLATIDSPVVGEARLDLFAKLQALEIADTQAGREETVFGNTMDLLEHLRRNETPERIHEVFRDRIVGANRERLMTAYSQFRLAQATIDRNRDLFAQKLIPPRDFDQVVASYEVAQSTYQSLVEEMGYEARLTNTRAQQARRQADTAVRAAREHLRILGVKPDGTEPKVEGGKVVGVAPDGSLAVDSKRLVGDASPESVLPDPADATPRALKPPGVDGADPAQHPVSTYSIWAPFDGTILDREMIVPGVAVDTTHRIFTMANLADVWVEASVHEADFEQLDRIRQRGGQVRFESPAYPGRTFEGEMIYSGDLVEEQSRTVKLLARAKNPDRLLRPGMFVEVEILSPRKQGVARVPASALLVDGSTHYVYVRTGSERFERREVECEAPRDDEVAIRSGLRADEEVVVEGAYKLKALATQAATGAEAG